MIGSKMWLRLWDEAEKLSANKTVIRPRRTGPDRRAGFSRNWAGPRARRPWARTAFFCEGAGNDIWSESFKEAGQFASDCSAGSANEETQCLARL